MARLGIAHLVEQPFTEISAGERQMVLIARALTQQPTLLIMDEPTSNLDLGNQVRVLRQIRALASAGLAIVMISHTRDHAFSVATTAALLQQDGTLQVGPPQDIVTAANLASAYGETVLIVAGTAPDGTTIQSCVPLLCVHPPRASGSAATASTTAAPSRGGGAARLTGGGAGSRRT